MNNFTIVAGLLGTAFITGHTWVAWVAGGWCVVVMIATVWETYFE